MPRLMLVGWFLMVFAGSVAGAMADPDATSTEGPQRARFSGATEVVASRIAGDAEAAGRRQVVLTRVEIEKLPVESTQDLLALIPGVGLQRRGARGVQADLNLRGGTFEQVAVLVNGVRVNNPQTGHHNLDIFIPLAAIDRIEVLYGPGSAVHGPDAFGGAINIVTGPPQRQAFVRLGEHHLSGAGVAGSLERGLWAALEREVHTGFRDGTEADVNQGAGGWSWSQGERSAALTVAAGERDFGAWSFYSTRFPAQRESTEGQLLTLTAETPLGGQRLALALRLQRHRDDFILDRERPDWYRNRHRSRSGMLNLGLAGAAGSWDWAVGVEAVRDDLDSTNLGRHHRSRAAAFAEIGRFDGPHTFAIQLRRDYQQPWGSVGMVAAGGSWRLGERLRLGGHWGTSFRAPSFTELHYLSPSRVGNPELEPERGRTAEISLTGGPWSLTAFERRTRSLIDYLLDDDGVWQATNVGTVRTRGAEAALELAAVGRLRWQRLSVVVLDSQLGVEPERSAYALAHPEIEAAWSGSLDLGAGFEAGWGARFRDPGERGSWAALDLSLSRRILEHMTLSIEASNAFDRAITELHGVPLPGRWLSLTLRYRDEG